MINYEVLFDLTLGHYFYLLFMKILTVLYALFIGFIISKIAGVNFFKYLGMFFGVLIIIKVLIQSIILYKKCSNEDFHVIVGQIKNITHGNASIEFSVNKYRLSLLDGYRNNDFGYGDEKLKISEGENVRITYYEGLTNFVIVKFEKEKK